MDRCLVLRFWCWRILSWKAIWQCVILRSSSSGMGGIDGSSSGSGGTGRNHRSNVLGELSCQPKLLGADRRVAVLVPRVLVGLLLDMMLQLVGLRFLQRS